MGLGFGVVIEQADVGKILKRFAQALVRLDTLWPGSCPADLIQTAASLFFGGDDGYGQKFRGGYRTLAVTRGWPRW